MSVNVMIVDDSTIVRALISRTLAHQPHISVVATAGDGEEAIKTAKIFNPDVIILDIEMPNMDGFEAMPFLIKELPNVRIIIVSRLTQRNAQKSLEALQKGAADYIPKPMNDDQLDAFFGELVAKVMALGEPGAVKRPVISNPAAYVRAMKETAAVQENVPGPERPVVAKSKGLVANYNSIEAIGIASSTGGPQALLRLFESIKGKSLRVPIFITQHMPPAFTACLAQNLTVASGGIQCSEAKDGEEVKAGLVYIAPGGYHMTVEARGHGAFIALNQNDKVNSCRPSADPMFESLSRVYKSKLLALVLTGMGRDGCDGTRFVEERGGKVISQDAASCVVYGMPKAVADAGIGVSLSLDDIVSEMLKYCH